VTDLLRSEGLRLPKRRRLSSRASNGFEFVLGHRKAAALGTAAAIGLAASAYFGIGYARYGYLAAAEQAAARRAESTNADLQDALAQLRDQLGAANRALGLAQDRLAALSNEANKQLAVSEQAATSKADRVAQLTHALEETQRELHLAEAQRVTLLARLSKANTDLTEEQARQQQAQAGLDQWQKKLQQLTGDHDKAAGERNQLHARLGDLEQQHLQPTQQPPQPVAEVHPEPASPTPVAVAPAPAPAQAIAPQVAPAAPAQAIAPQVAPVAPAQAIAPQVAPAAPAVAPQAAAPAGAGTDREASSGRLAQFERVLASAGVDVEHLFADLGVRGGLGGPFIPAQRGNVDPTPSPETLASLHNLAEALPLSAPMENYRETSPFGGRQDPFNGRLAFHPGVDLAAPYGTPVYATAAGVVTFAGYRSDYGKIVEINHDHGIVTRYGHLARYTVLVGERVAAGTQIGYEGSTGRSTGPHVIYEVDVNGEPQDPDKFLMLARYIPAAR
jgi:murein DD-endopeptidase MepM/ murein hydrolase activator NlpD